MDESRNITDSGCKFVPVAVVEGERLVQRVKIGDGQSHGGWSWVLGCIGMEGKVRRRLARPERTVVCLFACLIAWKAAVCGREGEMEINERMKKEAVDLAGYLL